MADQPVIIKKIKKNKGHEHHGGAWKLAYADFVTAMMAFFLLMWLVGTTDETTKRGIAEYFQDPDKVTLLEETNGGARTSLIQGGGADLAAQEQGQVNKGQITETEEQRLEDIEKQAEQTDLQQLELLKKKIQSMINANSNLAEFKDQIKLETTQEGLRVQIIDNKNTPMFKIASAETEPDVRLILRKLAPVINELPNKITINGHTDALSFPANQTGYTNWELSSDRANAARYELNQGGLAEQKILRVSGLSSSIPYNPKDALDPMNRRISIIVMNKKTEQQILEEAGSKPETKKSMHSGTP
ncbi:protein that enables flagellar motor rotation [Candidatus Methylobacter favarea]|uniref:Protein that enables flagellar motor rotation n=1 Tax=Candidatus Methylobacter favarea TaxID=2707345 RepID=A0A8S0XR50_9GAMM|nr:flagellar motor protein MotB [Candidatus Methylobacter favarea]CAA9889757.1 protein that enables flagellar motor rotation [Candidatus Methylobacter favarea]